MPTAHRRITVAASPRDAFDLVADFGRTVEWDPSVRATRRRDVGPVDVGASWDVDVAVGPLTVTLTYRIVRSEPPDRVVLEARGSGLTGGDDVRFTADPAGTRIDWTVSIGGRGLLAPVGVLLGPGLERTADRAVDGLRQALDAEAVAADGPGQD